MPFTLKVTITRNSPETDRQGDNHKVHRTRDTETQRHRNNLTRQLPGRQPQGIAVGVALATRETDVQQMANLVINAKEKIISVKCA